MEADGKMGVHLGVSSGGYLGRLEVLEGPTGRLARTASEKARIAAESLMPGSQVTAVARKHGATRWQIYDWRRRLLQGQFGAPEGQEPRFAPLMMEEAPSLQLTAEPSKSAPAKVEIEIDGMVIRTAVEVEQLAQLIRAVRAS
jgi:transposase